ncbi:contact-dependent growth inhibition system immunity protein [Streptomyces sp. NPDC002537]
MTRSVKRDRSLEQLEGDRWPDPPADAGRLVVTASALRRKPVGELTVEDLRLLIQQDIGLPHLLPLAVEVLHQDPLAEGDLYEGDLLAAVVSRGPAVWRGAPELAGELRGIVAGLTGLPRALRREVDGFLTAVGP